MSRSSRLKFPWYLEIESYFKSHMTSRKHCSLLASTGKHSISFQPKMLSVTSPILFTRPIKSCMQCIFSAILYQQPQSYSHSYGHPCLHPVLIGHGEAIDGPRQSRLGVAALFPQGVPQRQPAAQEEASLLSAIHQSLTLNDLPPPLRISTSTSSLLSSTNLILYSPSTGFNIE